MGPCPALTAHTTLMPHSVCTELSCRPNHQGTSVCVYVNAMWRSRVVCVFVWNPLPHQHHEITAVLPQNCLMAMRKKTIQKARRGKKRKSRKKKNSALRPNFTDIVPRLIAKIPPSFLSSLLCGSVALQGKKEVGF